MSEKWNWKKQREKRAFLALENGMVMHGYSIGAEVDTPGEVVFNTGMTGYQEILSDPSYHGQIVTMTYPEIGNTGVNRDDMESGRFYAHGFIVHNLNETSNWRASDSLERGLEKEGIPGIAGIDTRTLTALLRDNGTQKGYISVTGTVDEKEGVSRARAWEGLDNQDYAIKVSCTRPYTWDENCIYTRSWGIAENLPPTDMHIVAFDFGIKWNILRNMRKQGMKITVVPAKTTAAEVLAKKPDGVFLSNGPADPLAVSYAIETTRELIGKVPVMGICLGHQIIGLALGGDRFRLKFGHHGCNHPVMDIKTKRVEITSQNHNFAIDTDSLDPKLIEVTHINLNDRTLEGFEHTKEPVIAIQYHPEAGPGPHDPSYLFTLFRELVHRA
ncbi:MAG: glutamine-hydrolyzing carbamoyl-phosphate synthase small subunit [Spirochaetales bacterium]|nr:glutamine-hydrolyzing carbamoyl-phosphate synthase small subunit [Spirochaetales bacterium]